MIVLHLLCKRVSLVKNIMSNSWLESYKYKLEQAGAELCQAQAKLGQAAS